MLPTLKYLWKNHRIHLEYRPHYLSAIIGIIIFAFGGLGDVVWHGYYGFEVQLEAILSPTHLALYIGMFLIFIAPFNALNHEKKFNDTFKENLTLVLFITIIFSFFSFLTQYANPLISPFAFSTHRTGLHYYGQTIGLVSLFIHLTFLMIPYLMVLYRFKLPFGSLTLIFLLNAIGMTAIHDHFDFINAAFLAGLIGDVLVYKLKIPNTLNFQIISAVIPVIYSSMYFLVGWWTRGIWWSNYLVLGAIILSGFFGFAISLIYTSHKK
jgi:hypothetical protein